MDSNTGNGGTLCRKCKSAVADVRCSRGRWRYCLACADGIAAAKAIKRPRAYYYTPEYKRVQRERQAAREGRELVICRPKGMGRRAQERMARAAWREWIEVRAPAWWLAAYHGETERRKAVKAEIRKAAAAEYSRRREQEKRSERSAYYAARKPRRIAQRKAQSDGTLPLQNYQRLLRQVKRCTYCSRKLKVADPFKRTDADATLDHIVPLHLGGVHGACNVTVVCAACNLSKGAKLIADWIDQLPPDAAARTARAVERVTRRPPGQGVLL